MATADYAMVAESADASNSKDYASEDVAYDDAAADAGVAEESYDGATVELLGATPELTAEHCPLVALPDGTLLTTSPDGIVQEVDAAQVGESLGEGQAYSSETDETATCEVFALADDPDGFAVRYEGEDSYWLATRGTP